jgi:Raf kinase inhibitor-like YbhB/YbcL family protein
MRIRPAFLLVAISALAVGALAGPAFAASPAEKSKVKKITVTSAAFGNNKAIPSGFTCDGSSASPPLKFAKIPKSTKDVALIMTDPDLPGGGTFVHWVAWHLPKSGVPEETLPAGIVQGKNSIGNAAYAGPCPPAGSPPHHYIFTVSAVSKQITLAPGATADELRAAIKGNVLAQGTLTGTYQRATGAQ